MPSLILHFDDFGQRALAAHAEHRGHGASSVVGFAARHYLADRPARRPAWPVPRFQRSSGTHRSAQMEVLLDEETWGWLPAEAELQRVTPEALVEHAVLYFLADLHRGWLGSVAGAGGPLHAGR